MLLDLLAVEFTWSSLFVGLGAFLAGAGSVLSGIAALRVARREEDKHEATQVSDIPVE